MCPDRGTKVYPERGTKRCPGVAKMCPALGTKMCPDRGIKRCHGVIKWCPGVIKRCPDRGTKSCPDRGIKRCPDRATQPGHLFVPRSGQQVHSIPTDVEELAPRAVKAVEGHIIGVDGEAARRQQEGSQCVRRRWTTRGGGVKGASNVYLFSWYIYTVFFNTFKNVVQESEKFFYRMI